MSQSPPVRAAVSALMSAEHSLRMAALHMEHIGRSVDAQHFEDVRSDIQEWRRKIARIKAKRPTPTATAKGREDEALDLLAKALANDEWTQTQGPTGVTHDDEG